jgi:hypothetical protein
VTQPRRVLFASTSFPSSESDWKGLFIARMVEALADRDDVHLQAWMPPGPMPGSVQPVAGAEDLQWLEALMRDGGIAHQLRSRPLRGTLRAAGLLSRLRRAYRDSDAQLFHVNWLQNALPLPRDDRRPALITALGTDIQLLRLPGMKTLLGRVAGSRRTLLCPNADWMVPVLEAAFGDMARVQCVPFGIDAAWYRAPRMPAADGRHRWICVTRLTRDKLGPLFEWGTQYFATDPNRELHVFGPRQEEGIAIPDWVHFHGPATPGQLLQQWFPIATGLVTLSRHAEGRPQVMLEAMAAGLPILASRLPAHEDIVEHAATGWLCDDPSGMADGLAAIEDLALNTAMGERSRSWARERIGTWADCAGRYASLYGELLA